MTKLIRWKQMVLLCVTMVSMPPALSKQNKPHNKITLYYARTTPKWNHSEKVLPSDLSKEIRSQRTDIAKNSSELMGSIPKGIFEKIVNGSLESAVDSGKISATEPYIDRATPDRVVAYTGVTAIIPCFVNNLGQRMVAWVRHRDIHVLTVGRSTFTNDDRFLSHHEDGSNEWALRLRTPQLDDSGLYECQVSTKPIKSRLIHLEVVEPHAVISAGKELYIKYGSTLSLSCKVVDAPKLPDFLLWYHNQKVANYGQGRMLINTTSNENSTTSLLTVDKAEEHDSGTYTCNPSNAKEATVTVHVITGEHPAAMQTNSAYHVCGYEVTLLLYNLMILFNLPSIVYT